jgi:hypothetical protein
VGELLDIHTITVFAEAAGAIVVTCFPLSANGFAAIISLTTVPPGIPTQEV